MICKRCSFLVPILTLCLLSLVAMLPWGHFAHADDLPAALVRTTSPKTIDGNAGDWTTITTTQRVLTEDQQAAATFKLAYDATNFYALVNVIDASPLKNSAAVPEELIKGDAVSFCFGPADGKGVNQRVILAQIDGKPVLMVYRPKSAMKRPYTFASPVTAVKMDYVGPLAGARVALKPVAGGYIAEVALPWTALGLTPTPASIIPFDVQVIFADPAGMTNIASAWWHTAGGNAFTVEDLPTEAALYPDAWGTAQLFDKDPGPHNVTQQVAKVAGIPIIFTLPRAARVSLVVTDQTGWIVRELLRAEKMDAGRHTIEWNGRDRYDEVLPPGQYNWKLAYFDGMGSKFVGSVGNSARPPYRTEDGKGSMGGQHGGASVIGADASGIYILGGTEEGHPAMRKIDADGRTLWKRSMGGFGSGRAWASDRKYCYIINAAKTEAALVRLDPDTGKDVPIVEKSARIVLGDPKQLQVGGMAVAGNKVYFSVTGENRLGVVDLATGQIGQSIQINQPLGLCTVDERTVLVCTDAAVVKLDVATGKSTPFLSGLVAPRAVTRDTQGCLYVSNLGESQQIKKFSADGKLLATFGRQGGRPATAVTYDPLAFRNIVGLAVGPDASLWAVESSTLRRVAKLTTDGAWVTDLYGPVAYNVFGPDLDDLSTVYYQISQQTPDYAKTHVDYAAYARDPESPMAAWKIESIFRLTQESEDTTTPDLMVGAMQPGYGHVVAFTAKDGTRYLWRIAKSNRATTPTGAAIWRWENDHWIPACFISNDAKKSQSWSDTNGDGLAQATEMYNVSQTNRFAWLDRDLVLYGWSGTVAPVRVDARGVPYYQGGIYTPYLRAGQSSMKDGDVFNSMPDNEGAVYFAANYGTHRHMSFWDRACENQIVKVQNGEVQWIIGQHDAHPKQEGDMTTVSGIAGVVDNILIAHTVEPALYTAYTTDGLTLGNVIVDADGKQPKVGSNAVYIESFTGLFVKDPKTQQRLLFGVRSGDDFILEVTGPGRLDRMEGTITLDSSRPRETAAPGQVEIPYETWWGNVGRGYGIDGYDWEWLPKSAGLPINDGKTLIGDVRLRRDAGALYLLADVRSAKPLPAGTANNMGSLWGTSEGVELLLGPNMPADRRAPGVGDTRIFLTLDPQGKPVVLAYRPSDADAQWQIVKEAKVAIIPRWHDYGWRVEAEIPLTTFPDITAKTLQTFRRGTGDMETFTEERLDLVHDLRCNAAVFLRDAAGTLRRFPWAPDGQTVGDPRAMVPARWGSAIAPVAAKTP